MKQIMEPFQVTFYDPDTGKNWLGQSSPMA